MTGHDPRKRVGTTVMSNHGSFEDPSTIADWFAGRLLELCDVEMLDPQTLYHLGELSKGGNALGMTIEVSSPAGAIYVIEDRFGVLWLSCRTNSGHRSLTLIDPGFDVDSLLAACVQTLSH